LPELRGQVFPVVLKRSGGRSAWVVVVSVPPIASLVALAAGAPVRALPRTGWIATASVACSTEPPSRALDAQVGTRFSTCQNQRPGQWFRIDMLAPRAFSKITLDAAKSPGDYPRAYEVFATNDLAKWGAPIATGTGTTQLVSISLPNQRARYIKIVQTGSAPRWWSIHELDVHGVGR
jgi:hypothetical protein